MCVKTNKALIISALFVFTHTFHPGVVGRKCLPPEAFQLFGACQEIQLVANQGTYKPSLESNHRMTRVNRSFDSSEGFLVNTKHTAPDAPPAPKGCQLNQETTPAPNVLTTSG